MRTCSSRRVRPRLPSQCLFCEENEPTPTYRMSRCRSLFCSCCHPNYLWSVTPRWCVVSFGNSPLHRFLNGYTTYLNCPAVTTTIEQATTVTRCILDVQYLEHHLRHDVPMRSLRLCRFNRRHNGLCYGLYARHCYRIRPMRSLSLSLSLLAIDHREQGNRIIHETLTGHPLFQGSPLDRDEIK